MDNVSNIINTIASLRNMINEMNKKNIELGRITKTACLLLKCGVSPNSISPEIVDRCISEQNPDGGWVGIVDTLWNIAFLKNLDTPYAQMNISKGLTYLLTQKNREGLWGRSKRDISRIPVSGIMLYLHPELCNKQELLALENLWLSEKNSLTYKAAYTLMAFRKNDYFPKYLSIIEETVQWIVNNQKEDGGFSPWKDHPVKSDVFCTSIAILGLIQYKECVKLEVLRSANQWLITNQMHNGIWAFHEIEDGASWALLAMTEIQKSGVLDCG